MGRSLVSQWPFHNRDISVFTEPGIGRGAGTGGRGKNLVRYEANELFIREILF